MGRGQYDPWYTINELLGLTRSPEEQYMRRITGRNLTSPMNDVLAGRPFRGPLVLAHLGEALYKMEA